MHSRLVRLHEDIEKRVRHVRETSADWQCSKGCAACCHQLADVPRLTSAEWELLSAGLAALPAPRRDTILQALASLGDDGHRPIACPMLDPPTQACLVYLHRPVACRSYGFYVQRDRGLYCSDIADREARGEFADVIWGNHDVVDRQLAELGDTRAITEWAAGARDGSASLQVQFAPESQPVVR